MSSMGMRSEIDPLVKRPFEGLFKSTSLIGNCGYQVDALSIEYRQQHRKQVVFFKSASHLALGLEVGRLRAKDVRMYLGFFIVSKVVYTYIYIYIDI